MKRLTYFFERFGRAETRERWQWKNNTNEASDSPQQSFDRSCEFKVPSGAVNGSEDRTSHNRPQKESSHCYGISSRAGVHAAIPKMNSESRHPDLGIEAHGRMDWACKVEFRKFERCRAAGGFDISLDAYVLRLSQKKPVGQ